MQVLGSFIYSVDKEGFLSDSIQNVPVFSKDSGFIYVI